ncbi:hypothetical protein Back2_17210 [Nocardioides baekrokdamisoli]|uniref:Uncharacterized protein n=1 Tax=Nocardioides baekrokdamisoli TaxID=1804624 RepID=A0A3G9J1V3_9ACTN|nr:hypothetical protein [Nocardioides baekrokdamisoli]BBH17434.1 hypothetical protein Back2_17210 [Nocardioides baekrokdamisoli]
MRIGGSLALIFLGAVLRWAITYTPAGVSIPTVGTIVIVVGVIGLLLTLTLMLTRRRGDVVLDDTDPNE